jgi:hypothetical protein
MAAVFFIFSAGYLDGLLAFMLLAHQPVINLRHFLRRETIIHIKILATDSALALALSHGLDAGSRSAAMPIPPIG